MRHAREAYRKDPDEGDSDRGANRAQRLADRVEHAGHLQKRPDRGDGAERCALHRLFAEFVGLMLYR
jgi:hypothetical protein